MKLLLLISCLAIPYLGHAQTKKNYNSSSALMRATMPRVDYEALRKQKDRELQILLEMNRRSEEQLRRANQELELSNASDLMSCDNLLVMIKSRGSFKATLVSIDMPGTDWLRSVKIYQMNNNYFVIAEMVSDRYGLETKEYAYCGIPSQNWNAFVSAPIGGRLTHGERFHDYIIDYKCLCSPQN
ncbi:hypothetical protein [Dyadobacter bucti]|uniref:hypothetical protein n=1 Tax=Dyadobacter bucti TaxID=2572203 RepID=UPI001108A41F|nr:hypothetical protein [Dyadobacter bucti]